MSSGSYIRTIVVLKFFIRVQEELVHPQTLKTQTGWFLSFKVSKKFNTKTSKKLILIYYYKIKKCLILKLY